LERLPGYADVITLQMRWFERNSLILFCQKTTSSSSILFSDHEAHRTHRRRNRTPLIIDNSCLLPSGDQFALIDIARLPTFGCQEPDAAIWHKALSPVMEQRNRVGRLIDYRQNDTKSFVFCCWRATCSFENALGKILID
jgi:hypothetical protein